MPSIAFGSIPTHLVGGRGLHVVSANIRIAKGPQMPGLAPALTLNHKPYLGGQGDLVSRLIMGIDGVTIWVIGVINLLTKSPWPSK